mgnify:CR=1 FL=1
MSAVAAALIVSVACGSGAETTDSPTTVVEPSPTYQVIEVTVAPTSAVAPTPSATTAPIPTATAAADSETAGTLGDEQILLELRNRISENLFSEQWDRFNEYCTPAFRESDPRTPAEIETRYKAFLAGQGYLLENMSFGEPDVTVMGTAASMKFAIFQDGLETIEVTDFYTKLGDGNWYINCVRF